MNDKSLLRGSIFRHLDGLAVAPVAIALQKKEQKALEKAKKEESKMQDLED